MQRKIEAFLVGVVLAGAALAQPSLTGPVVPALESIRSTLDNPSARWIAARVIRDIESAPR